MTSHRRGGRSWVAAALVGLAWAGAAGGCRAGGPSASGDRDAVRGPTTPAAAPGGATVGSRPTAAPRVALTPRVATPSVPVYEGCFVAFDGPVAAAVTGTLELRLAADPAGQGGFASLELELLDCAGANRGRARDVGWTAVPTTRRAVTLDARSGAAVTVARGPLPAGAWDRVFVAAPTVIGVDAHGVRTALEAHVEPIARGFTLADGAAVAVTMQITTRARPAGWGGGWNVFTKDAWLDGEAPAAP